MSRTQHHNPWWKRLQWGRTVPQWLQRCGYEWCSGRPRSIKRSKRGWQDPGKSTKVETHRQERRWLKREVDE